MAGLRLWRLDEAAISGVKRVYCPYAAILCPHGIDG